MEYIREIGFTHLRISEGLNTQLQLLGCIARLANMVHNGTFQPVKSSNVVNNTVFQRLSAASNSSSNSGSEPMTF